MKVIASFRGKYEAEMAAKAAIEKLPEDIDHVTYTVIAATEPIRIAYQRYLGKAANETQTT